MIFMPFERSSEGRISQRMRNFNTLINDLNLMEVLLTNDNFTWSDGRDSPVFSLIDRFFVSSDWITKFKDSRGVELSRPTLDHFPTLTETWSFRWGSCLLDSKTCGLPQVFP